MVWYAAKSKGVKGGVYVFSAQVALRPQEISAMRKHVEWLSAPMTTKAETIGKFLHAGNFSRRNIPNPPSEVTVIHKGTVTVQHLSDPKVGAARKKAATLMAKRKTTLAKKSIKKNPIDKTRHAIRPDLGKGFVVNSQAKYYVGIDKNQKTIFRSSSTPVKERYGGYSAVIGPFRTKKAAFLMAESGNMIASVSHAEREARKKNPPRTWHKKKEAEYRRDLKDLPKYQKFSRAFMEGMVKAEQLALQHN